MIQVETANADQRSAKALQVAPPMNKAVKRRPQDAEIVKTTSAPASSTTQHGTRTRVLVATD